MMMGKDYETRPGQVLILAFLMPILNLPIYLMKAMQERTRLGREFSTDDNNLFV
jgi:hypothetical protein